MSKVKIAIIDSGVRIDHPRFKMDRIQGFTFCDGKVESEFVDTYGHGTAVYNIIRDVEHAEIINIKLQNIEQGVREEDIIHVLSYIYDNMEVDIINLSLGISVCEELNEFENICLKLSQKGVIVISAFDNAGSMSYPAAFKSVIGVTTSGNCTKINQYEYLSDTVINIAAYGKTQRLAWNSPDYIYLGGNSFACAHITVEVAKYLDNNCMTMDDVLLELKNHSSRSFQVEDHCVNNELPYVIHKAVLFPFNKEMHSLVRFQDILSFEIVDVYDTKYSGRIGASTGKIIHGNTEKNYIIKNIDAIDWDSFDTIIIGHLDELLVTMDRDEIRDQLTKIALQNKKNIYGFDDYSSFLSNETKSQLYYPKVSDEYLPPLRYGKLYRIGLPVLGIFGTSSKQGKFTLQLILRKLFLEHGFKIGQIGTEPSALLYGMDSVYPMGYNNNVYLRDFECIRYLNYITNQLVKKNVDLILVGSQSGTVSYDTGNIMNYNIPQYHFLMGTQPDTIILCVNPFDELPYITRTIQFIEASVEVKVIALVIFPMDISDTWLGIYGSKRPMDQENINHLKENLHQLYQLPVYTLGGAEINELFSLIINHYTA